MPATNRQPIHLMKVTFPSTIIFGAAFTLSVATAAGPSGEALSNWPQWRGPLVNGVAPEANPPSEWSETKNVKWKVGIPGFGTSTPIVWGNKIFILTAVSTAKPAEPKPAETTAAATPPETRPAEKSGPPGEDRGFGPGRKRGPGGPGGPGGGGGFGGPRGGGFGQQKPTDKYQFIVLCLDRSNGKTLWQKTVREEVPHEGHHQDHGYASGSPVTDGQVVIAYFGSRGIHCFDMDGNLKWEKDFGDMRTRAGFGEGTSPVLRGDTVIVNWDDENDNDFIIALDKRTGKELWKTPRSEDTTWATPLIVDYDKKLQAVVNATGKVRSYDLTSGKELWSCSGQTANAIPSPVADADTVYVTSGFRGNAVYAIALGRTGDLGDTDAVRWSHNKNTPYVPSPLLTDGLLYLVAGNNGMLSCFDAKTGKAHFEGERLEGLFGIYASPVAAKDRVYVLGRDGKCLVLKKGPTLEILATNKLDDRTDASIAAVGKEIFIRGHKSLYCIAEK